MATRHTANVQKLKFKNWAERQSTPVSERMARLERQTQCGYPALARRAASWRTRRRARRLLRGRPRTAFLRLRNSPVPWTGRGEDPADDGVWAVTCFVTRAGFRRRGIGRALARATVDFARESGARAIEGYPMLTEPGQEITWGEMNVGSRSIFADAGFEDVSRPPSGGS